MTPADRATLLALAERVESAAGDDAMSRTMRALNADILRATGWREAEGDVIDPAGNLRMQMPFYVASLDAAMTLVPEGWRWMAGQREQPHARAYVENGELAFVGAGSRRNPQRLWFEVTAATPALALVAAALRAHAALLGEGEG